MRKVIYTEWVRGIETEEYKQSDPFDQIGINPFIEGTNCYIEKEGLFHGFFQSFDYVGQNNETAPIPVALIEDEDGKMLQLSTDRIRFIDKSEDATVDWEQRRWEASVKIFCAKFNLEPYNASNFANSVQDADELIAELKKQKPC